MSSCPVPEEFHLSDEAWGWAKSERQLGSSELELARAREALARENFLDFLWAKLENDEALQGKLYELIRAKG